MACGVQFKEFKKENHEDKNKGKVSLNSSIRGN